MTRTRMPRAYNFSSLESLKDKIGRQRPFANKAGPLPSPDFKYSWLMNNRRCHFVQFDLYIGRCTFPQRLSFRGDPGYYIEVECFNVKDPLNHRGPVPLILNRSIKPFTIETTTPYMLSRIAYIIQLLCHGEDHQFGETLGLYDDPSTNIHLTQLDDSMAVCVSHPEHCEQILELWDAQFFPPDGVDTVIKLINDIRHISMKYFW